MAYQHGASRAALAAQIDAQARRLHELEAEAAATITAANKAAHNILSRAITRAEQIRVEANTVRHEARVDADNIVRAARLKAEKEQAIIRERAYLQGRAQADRERVKFDARQAGTHRRNELRSVA